MCSDGWMNRDKAETMAPLPCCLVQDMSVFYYVWSMTMGKPTNGWNNIWASANKKADCSYTYININYRLRGSNEYLNRHMEDHKEFD